MGDMSKNFDVRSSYHNNLLNEKNLRESLSRRSGDKKVFFDKKHSSEKLSIALEKLMINNEKRKRIMDKLQKEKSELILKEKINASSNIMKNSLILNKAKNAFKSNIKQKNDCYVGDGYYNGHYDHNNENLNDVKNMENKRNNSMINYDDNDDEYNSKSIELSSKFCDMYPSWTDHVNRRNPLSSTEEAKKERLEYLDLLKNSQIQLNGIPENKIKNILTLRMPKPKTENHISSEII